MSESQMSQSQTSSNGFPYLFRLLHWVLTVSFLILFLTGLSLHAAARPEWSVFSGKVPSWLWNGRAYVWHFWAAVVFFPSVLGSLAYCWQERFWRRPTHIILTGGGLVTILTGLWMMFPFGPVRGVKLAVGLHAACGMVLLAGGFLWHVIGGVTTYVRFLVPSFHPFKEPKWSHVAGFVVCALLTTWIMFEGWPINVPWRNLSARRVEADVKADTELASLPWDDAAPLKVRMVNGSGFFSGQSDLTLRAMHNGNELFVKAQWQDPTANFTYWPWMKTEEGWEHLVTSSKDETVHYEDKFSLAFPIKPSWHFEQVGCAIYCHVDGAYGWGYKGGQPDIDVWHWKSTRTAPVGQVDDKYWSELDFENKDNGRHGDPKDGGGYQKNNSEDGKHPLYLPAEGASIGHGAILKSQTVDYSAELADKIKPETLIPGIICEPFQGDRGDVTCVSQHRNDLWTLYMRRKLDTGSEHDVRFTPGGSHSFGCAAFDHAGKRHAYSMPVFRLVLEP